MAKTIITIGRQFGSGGREIGMKLAQALDIPFYDNKLLEIAASESGIDKSLFEENDEKPVNSLLYMLSTQYTDDNTPFNHKLFLAQFSAIKKIARQGACVIVGRCADYALQDFDNVLNVFIYADIEKRMQRAVSKYQVPDRKAREIVVRTDKQRSGYYNFYAGRKWGRLENYHLTLDSGMLGVDKSAELIKTCVEFKEKA